MSFLHAVALLLLMLPLGVPYVLREPDYAVVKDGERWVVQKPRDGGRQSVTISQHRDRAAAEFRKRSLPRLRLRGLFMRFDPATNERSLIADWTAQEDARRIVWSGPAALQMRWPARAFAPQAALSVRYQLDAAPTAPLRLRGLGTGQGTTIDLQPTLARGAGKGWQTMEVPLACLNISDLAGIELAGDAQLTIGVTSIAIVPQATDTDCNGPF